MAKKGSLTAIMRKLQIPAHPAVYRHVTGHVAEQVAHYMNDAQRQAQEGASTSRERAYGLYLGWRAFAVEMTTARQFALDDRAIEQLFAAPRPALPGP
jgi:hypothetical protein